ALYPHMSVYDNMAFGLKLRKMDKGDIDRRVKEAAEILEITEFLERKPKALSGGQRQRVAMGRAIVREPKAFLMDEPLSNLDAKLRVQMRTELSELHNRLGTTTVYVTHDQVEAMTLGHRVAVLKPVSAARPDNLQQVAPPSELYSNPVNLFVAGFIGSPAMNMVNAVLEQDATGLYCKFGSEKLLVDQTSIDRHPGLASMVGQPLVMGIRPGNFEAEAITGPSPDRTITAKVTVAEILGSETFVHFELEIPPVVTPDIEELLADTGGDVESLGNTTKFTARVSSDVQVRLGETISLTVDTAKMHFFDPHSGMRIGTKE
ncbi:MAG: ATP-binding cassette domain-containing protein, partial [Acidimicrobiia bacterium]|nr:ATP-binding cassette domain-containing protein [Acidimicrobiia bacterium]